MHGTAFDKIQWEGGQVWWYMSVIPATEDDFSPELTRAKTNTPT
jgi:hypothetical protein